MSQWQGRNQNQGIDQALSYLSQRIQEVDLKSSRANVAGGVPVYTLATLPAAGQQGRVAFASDSPGSVRYDNGSTWVELATGTIYGYDNVSIDITGSNLRIKPEVGKLFRGNGSDATGTVGAAAEVQYISSAAQFGGYNRTTAAYIPTIIYGSTITIMPNGTQALLVNATGVYPGNQSANYFGGAALCITLNGNQFAWADSSYVRLLSPNGTLGNADYRMLIGGSADPANYYDNTQHIFRDIAHTTNLAKINATGIYPGNQTTKYIANEASPGGLILETPYVYQNNAASGTTNILGYHSGLGIKGVMSYQFNYVWPGYNGAGGWNTTLFIYASLANGRIGVSGGLELLGTAYNNPDYVLEDAFTGHINKWAMQPGAATYRRLTLLQVMDHARAHYALPNMPDSSKDASAFDILSGLTLNLERAILFIAELESRIATLEGAR